MEFITGMTRTDYCGNFRISDVGKEITVFGWVQRSRNLGSLIFIDLRDRSGIVQLAFDDATATYTPDGRMKFIYLKDEFAGFAIHLLLK